MKVIPYIQVFIMHIKPSTVNASLYKGYHPNYIGISLKSSTPREKHKQPVRPSALS